GKLTAPVTTGQIYWGAVPFVVVQVIMVAIVIAFPGLVTGSLAKSTVDPSKIEIQIPALEDAQEGTSPPDFGPPSTEGAGEKPETEGANDKEGEDLGNLFKQPK
ncbi:MAG: hypothetical protein HYY28_03560, partial [Betaproteobacteria bacterium]|nr:hypothetical protein [Betaproteobacteria bacterium]